MVAEDKCIEMELQYSHGTGSQRRLLCFWPSDANRFIYNAGCLIAEDEIEGNSPQKLYRGHDGLVTALCIGRSSFIASGQSVSGDTSGKKHGKIILWDKQSRTIYTEITSMGGDITAIGLSDSEVFLAAADDLGSFRIYDISRPDRPLFHRGGRGIYRLIIFNSTDTTKSSRGTPEILFCAFECSVVMYTIELDARKMDFSVGESTFSMPTQGLIRRYTSGVIKTL